MGDGDGVQMTCEVIVVLVTAVAGAGRIHIEALRSADSGGGQTAGEAGGVVGTAERVDVVAGTGVLGGCLIVDGEIVEVGNEFAHAGGLVILQGDSLDYLACSHFADAADYLVPLVCIEDTGLTLCNGGEAGAVLVASTQFGQLRAVGEPLSFSTRGVGRASASVSPP